VVEKANDGLNRRKEDYETVFSTEAGSRVVADLMAQFNVGRSSHTSGDSHETAFREGERHVILHVLHMLGKRGDPEWINDKLDQGEIEYSIVQEFA